MELLELEEIEDFSYFENFSALMECDELLEYDLFFEILNSVGADTLSELTDTYFEDIMLGVPDDDMDIYTLFNSIRHTLLTLAKSTDSARNRALYAEELFKFRTWFLYEGMVRCTRVADGSVKRIAVSEAMTLYRLEKLSHDNYEYDFSEALDYELDDYALTVAEELESYNTDFDEEEPERPRSIDEREDDLFDDGLIDREFPVIDEEFEEDLE